MEGCFWGNKKAGSIYHPKPSWMEKSATKYYPLRNEHTWLYENYKIHGIDLVIAGTYYPEVHRWAIDKNLAFISATDISFELSKYTGNDSSLEFLSHQIFHANRLSILKIYLDQPFKKERIDPKLLINF